jgi:hypothetical protein
MLIHLKKSRSGTLGLRSLVHLRRGRALGVLLTAAVVACGGDSTGPESIEGTYTLETINARALPVVVQQDAVAKVEVTAGAITLGPGTRWSIGLTARTTAGADISTMSVTLDGTWTRSGSILTLTTDDGDSETVVLSGRTLTLQGEAGEAGSGSWVFRR